jgi:hypothetical protein
MLMRRRPLLRVALVAGIAYYAGTKVARSRRHNDERRP